MTRCLIGTSIFTCFSTKSTASSLFRYQCHLKRWYAKDAESDVTEEDLELARKWSAEFKSDTLPRDIGDVSFSRSSGPGGQNVNKVNSKAQLRVPVDKLFDRIPRLLHRPVLSSRFHMANSRSLLIQADDSRKQAENIDACHRKLYELLAGLASANIPGATSQAQKQKVKKLQRSSNESRLRGKKVHSNKKSSRSKGNDS